MSIFTLGQQVIDDYSNYVQSFLTIADERVREFLDQELLTKASLWPRPLLQLNPAYAPGNSVQGLVDQGKLHPVCAEVFCEAPRGQSYRLHLHQEQAIERALRHEPFVLTSGTGSGKTLAYFVPIFDAVLKNNPQEANVRAIIAYPMNALVNSQAEALKRLKEGFEERTGKELPVRFAKYTGQEKDPEKEAIRRYPPHILLTNYVMLELMLLRPEEAKFVDRAATRLEFLVFDELHTYRGRQGADVALLVRRIRERCGNPSLLCIGTSATMVSGKETGHQERREAVARFASKLFGIDLKSGNVIEETLQRSTSHPRPVSGPALCTALQSPPPQDSQELAQNPVAAWIEDTFGLEEEAGGNLRRRKPISLQTGASQLAELTHLDPQACEERLREFFVRGSQLRNPEGKPLLAFKLHQFLAQGRAIYATAEPASARYLTLEGQYYAPGLGKRPLFPLVFCRICGQDYYPVILNEEAAAIRPWDTQSEAPNDGEGKLGYLLLNQEGGEIQWNPDHLPAEWLDEKGRVKRDYRECVPHELWVRPDGGVPESESAEALKAWFQPEPLMLCLNCGEFYTGRDKNDFKKLARLSSEARSTATTILSLSALIHGPENGIGETARKILSFTDARQDASLQAGHFNDFSGVSMVRAAIYSALETHGTLSYDSIAARVVDACKAMGITLKEIAQNPELDQTSPQAKAVWDAFHALIEYRVYEDLRRGWRVVQPNLEQCGLLAMDYAGLGDLCANGPKWGDIPGPGLISLSLSSWRSAFPRHASSSRTTWASAKPSKALSSPGNSSTGVTPADSPSSAPLISVNNGRRNWPKNFTSMPSSSVPAPSPGSNTKPRPTAASSSTFATSWPASTSSKATGTAPPSSCTARTLCSWMKSTARPSRQASAVPPASNSATSS